MLEKDGQGNRVLVFFVSISTARTYISKNSPEYHPLSLYFPNTYNMSKRVNLPKRVNYKFDEVFRIANSGSEQGVYALVGLKKETLVCIDSFVWILRDIKEVDETSDRKLSEAEVQENAARLKTHQENYTKNNMMNHAKHSARRSRASRQPCSIWSRNSW